MGRNTTIIGGGAWGTALAVHLAHNGHRIDLWLRERELVARINEERRNPIYLPGIPIPEGVTAHANAADALQGSALVLLVVPSAFARALYREIAADIPAGVPLVVAAKGIEERTLALPLTVVREEIGDSRPVAALCGPSFAQELAIGRPTVVAVSSECEDTARLLQRALSSSTLRLYTNTDPTGVQLSGALKNVMAIAAGVADSLGMGSNTMAALITRGLVEMSRLGTRLGGRASTFSGLAGLGDLVLTCTGGLSRNRGVGQRLGRGERLEDILASSPSVPEGVHTTRSARELARLNEVEMPIVEEVHRILRDEGSARDAIARLMRRPLTSE
jgi:glycerol-3-phosphate dehydrogenase (NAD(P)+)